MSFVSQKIGYYGILYAKLSHKNDYNMFISNTFTYTVVIITIICIQPILCEWLIR